MSVFLWEDKLSYIAVPKCACTSIKSMFFQIENGREFLKFKANGRVKHLHNVAYPTLEYRYIPHNKIKDHTRVTVVRDPVTRFLSAYSNRVVHYKALAPKKLKDEYIERGAVPNPTIEEFINNFHLYRRASEEIKHHTDPLVKFVGDDKNYFEKVFTVNELDDFEKWMSKRLAKQVVLPHLQSGGPKILADDIDRKLIRKIQEFYEADYESYGVFF